MPTMPIPRAAKAVIKALCKSLRDKKAFRVPVNKIILNAITPIQINKVNGFISSDFSLSHRCQDITHLFEELKMIAYINDFQLKA